MKKATAILLLSIYLFSMPLFRELFKVDMLVAHYFETKKNESTTSFYQFLVMHYLTDDLNDEDNDRDMQLPFKSLTTNIFSTSIFCIPNLGSALFVTRVFTDREMYKKIAKNLLVIADFNYTIWHPPKYALLIRTIN